MRTIFIDESGDLGTKDRYFVIALLIAENSKRLSNIIKRFCIQNSLDEVKASKLSFSDKQWILNNIANRNDYQISYIVVDKHKLVDRKIFFEKNLLYCYVSSLILEKIISNTSEDYNIIFDNRSVKIGSGNTLSDYIKVSLYTSSKYNNKIFVSLVNSLDSKMIQAVDLMANAVYAKYNYGKKHLFNLINIDKYIEFPID